jgi:hypothetical protein
MIEKVRDVTYYPITKETLDEIEPSIGLLVNMSVWANQPWYVDVIKDSLRDQALFVQGPSP